MKKIILTATVVVLLSLGLAACSGGSGAGAASTASSGASSEQSAPSESAGSAAQAASASASPSATATPAASGASAASGGAAAPSTTADGKQTATGTVVTTTYAERAAEVGLSGNDYADDTSLLTLLVLDAPIQVSAYKGGSDYTGAASVICLPNDEMFRQFSGKQITVSVDSWGEWPADLSGRLYDLVVDFDADGLDLVEG